MANETEVSVTRWAGVPLADRRDQRRDELVTAAFELFGTGGEAAVSVRAVCRASHLHARYFYASFADTDELIGAVYDRVSGELSARLMAELDPAGDDARARLRLGIHVVLEFSSADPRRGRILFTDARTNPVLADRRQAAQQALMDAVLQLGRGAVQPHDRVSAAMFTGAMVELVHQWLNGALGRDLDAVVEFAATRALPLTLG
jgi:AcrR family transcriptional regulator